MTMPTSRQIEPSAWHTQDWLLVLEALVLFTQEWTEKERIKHAECLIEEIAISQGALPSELLLQIDEQYTQRR